MYTELLLHQCLISENSVSILLVDYVKFGLSSGLIQPTHFLATILATTSDKQVPLFYAPKSTHYSCLLDIVKQIFKESVFKIVDTNSDTTKSLNLVLQVTINLVTGLDFNIDRLIEWLLGQQQQQQVVTGITSNFIDSVGYKNSLKSLQILNKLFVEPSTLGLLLLSKYELPSMWKQFEEGIAILLSKHANVSFFLDIWNNLKLFLKLVLNKVPSSFSNLVNYNLYSESTEDSTLLPSVPLTIIDMLLEEDVNNINIIY